MRRALLIALLLAAPSALLAADPLAPCLDHWEHGRRAEARQCYRAALRASGDPLVEAEAAWKLGDKQQANNSFKAALKARPKDPHTRVRWGRLFLDTYNKAEAAKLFQEALQLDPKSAEARLGLALVAAEGFERGAIEEANQALQLDPDLTEAHTLLAFIALEDEDTRKATEHLDHALSTKGCPLEAYALHAAMDYLAGKPDSEWVKKALAYNPVYGDIYAIPAHFFVITRRYKEAVDLYKQAVALDPDLWDAHAQLGANLWRLGNEAEARQHFETAFKGDPFSPVTVNSLRLMDSMKRFQTFTTPRIVLKLQQKESDLLRPYFEELLLKAIGTYQDKYHFTPKQPVQLEVYPDHEDFAVRTMGLPGLGALGVTFGYVVAMDSPSARSPGSFHWGSTLWHELCHVFVLEETNHMAPRWISEGLSVYEESMMGEGWGDPMTLDVIRAIKDKKLLPIADLDRGFMRPTYPSQVPVSYFQAGAVCKMIAEKWGFPKLLAMLQDYAKGATTEQAIQKELGVSPAEFDKQFAAFLRPSTEKVVASIDEWRKLMEQVIHLAREKKLDEAIEPARRARDLYPGYVEAGNAYEILSEALLAKGDKAAAAAELEKYRLAGGHSPRLLKQLASLDQDLGNRAAAEHVLEQLLWIWPGDEDLHARLGQFYLDDKQPRLAVREFEALLAMKPLDQAAAHFHVAQAYYQLNDREKTREHVLASLEAAPGYRPAQKLLLEIDR
ncbi:MAG TPA: tetratricopeptide repeat protein [Bryobacterales bacterium]|nr:tetratricopeptide repeat protein [Bryobacterales bacterium]